MGKKPTKRAPQTSVVARRERMFLEHPELFYFSRAVRMLALEQGLSLVQVRTTAELSKSNFVLLLNTNNRRMPTLDTFYALADGLGVTPQRLIGKMEALAALEVGRGNGNGASL